MCWSPRRPRLSTDCERFPLLSVGGSFTNASDRRSPSGDKPHNSFSFILSKSIVYNTQRRVVMTTQSKRKMISLAGAAAVLVASVAIADAQSEVDASATGDQDPLIGTWVVHVIPMGRPEFTAISSFNLGGLFAQMDTNSGTTSALGRWNRIGDLTYTNDFILFNETHSPVRRPPTSIYPFTTTCTPLRLPTSPHSSTPNHRTP